MGPAAFPCSSHCTENAYKIWPRSWPGFQEKLSALRFLWMVSVSTLGSHASPLPPAMVRHRRPDSLRSLSELERVSLFLCACLHVNRVSPLSSLWKQLASQHEKKKPYMEV